MQDAVARGATLVAGGRSEGRVYAPTILTNVPAEAPICREETFGPVLVVQAVDDAEQALVGALDTPYGLCAGIMTGDQDRGLELKLAQRFNCGMVHVNGPTMASEPSLPNGGVKDSGWGRSGRYAVGDFTEIRLTTLTRGGDVTLSDPAPAANAGRTAELAAVSLDDLLDGRKVGLPAIAFLAVATLALVSDGFDLAAIGYVGPELIKQWHVAPAELVPVFSAGIFGLLAGAPLFGFVGDRFGRKTAILTGLCVFGGVTLATAAASSLSQLVALRFLTGLGLGGVILNARLLRSPNRRGADAAPFGLINQAGGVKSNRLTRNHHRR